MCKKLKTNIWDDSTKLQAWTVAHSSTFSTLNFKNGCSQLSASCALEPFTSPKSLSLEQFSRLVWG